ncbi:hypothetical protein IAR50_002393 [Cryptococcus sp. DSM 104548]
MSSADGSHLPASFFTSLNYMSPPLDEVREEIAGELARPTSSIRISGAQDMPASREYGTMISSILSAARPSLLVLHDIDLSQVSDDEGSGSLDRMYVKMKGLEEGDRDHELQLELFIAIFSTEGVPLDVYIDGFNFGDDEGPDEVAEQLMEAFEERYCPGHDTALHFLPSGSEVAA